jgi:hypothetical protein
MIYDLISLYPLLHLGYSSVYTHAPGVHGSKISYHMQTWNN